jgi:hypothetical protein
LSAEEEGKMLSLDVDQRRIVAENDRKAKNDYISVVPNINNPGVKNHDKYKQFVNEISGSQRGEVIKH